MYVWGHVFFKSCGNKQLAPGNRFGGKHLPVQEVGLAFLCLECIVQLSKTLQGKAAKRRRHFTRGRYAWLHNNDICHKKIAGQISRRSYLPHADDFIDDQLSHVIGTTLGEEARELHKQQLML